MTNKQAYKLIDRATRTTIGSLAHKIYFKFMNKTTAQIVAAMNSGKRNIDDETFELIERCQSANIDWYFDQTNDKVIFTERGAK